MATSQRAESINVDDKRALLQTVVTLASWAMLRKQTIGVNTDRGISIATISYLLRLLMVGGRQSGSA